MLKTLTTKKTHQPNTVSSNTHATTKTTNFKIKIKNRLSQRRTRRLLCVQDTCALTQNTQHTSPPIPQTLPQTHTKKQKQKTKEQKTRQRLCVQGTCVRMRCQERFPFARALLSRLRPQKSQSPVACTLVSM